MSKRNNFFGRPSTLSSCGKQFGMLICRYNLVRINADTDSAEMVFITISLHKCSFAAHDRRSGLRQRTSVVGRYSIF